MDSWEVAFREKSRRRRLSGRAARQVMKAAILLLLFASIGAAIYLFSTGMR